MTARAYACDRCGRELVGDHHPSVLIIDHAIRCYAPPRTREGPDLRTPGRGLHAEDSV